MQSNIVSCNFYCPIPPFLNPKVSEKPISKSKETFHLAVCAVNSRNFSTFPICSVNSHLPNLRRNSSISVCCIEKKKADFENETAKKEEGRDWTTSILLLAFYVALMYYVFMLTPNQTPTADIYFLKKLVNLIGDDGYRMNRVLVSLWYIMGLWPLIYSMLLLPTARSTDSKFKVWPFCVSSFFGGAYALLPYFILWKPPPPPVDETELGRWPLNLLESKLVAGVSLAAGIGMIVYGVLAGGDDWKEFLQYFRQSKFIHVMSLDFCLLSAFSPFWVYNDMTARKWYEKGSWLLPLSLLPLVGPALYLTLRPSLSQMPISLEKE